MTRTSSYPLVSIVVPCYNHGKYVREAIESVASQDYPRIELIVLDDGSTDDTRALLAHYTGRFHVESHPNMGQSRTLNKGWAMSRGEILAYLSADDFLLPGAVAAAVEKLAASPDVVLTYCDFNHVDRSSQVLRTIRTPEFRYSDLAVRMVCQPGPGTFFRRNAFERAGFWDEHLRLFCDYEYWLRLGLEGPFARIPRVLAAYRVHTGSQSFSAADPARAEEAVKVVSAYFANERIPREISRMEREAVSHAHILSARLHLVSRRYRRALEHLGQAFALHPGAYLEVRTWRMIANALFNQIGTRLLWALGRAFP
jgi:glycosyltransferase involved in cell wall biosynthesis